MRKSTFQSAATLPTLIVGALLLSGCGDSKKIRFLGMWNGGFEVSGVGGKNDLSLKGLEALSLSGYLKVLANKNEYWLKLDGKQQGIEIKGKWSYDDASSRLTLRPNDIQIDDGGGEEFRDPNKPWVPVEKLRAAYEKPIVLDLKGENKKYEGLEMSVGSLQGVHRFEKAYR
jgi:hypothetical protein